ncbi:nucleotide exchange factor GrpE [Vitiosangium sp. GDMCC 1.1324]|uniref:nucleotide exchange factor GrpE n=1 Tax=Vitiosangium sp. (strain GDMCC 1.1324) TaxID=2138576 RepID=UPI000D386A62|nr:nucleotide exchange factor GrpE [Vitiosangium sp. GDMCC 1.1324]PTL75670.1 nucleotide exchange factor GrpE [Vitiosangium sp. GDMCC 1.1324]
MNGNPRTDGPSQENQGPEAATVTAAPETSPEQQQEAPPQAAAPAVDPEKERLESELSAARRRVDQLARAYQELERDREEFKQRLTRERERMMDVERGNVATLLLEAVDELDRTLAMGGGDASSPLTQGVKMIRDGLLSKLQQTGIERLQVVGLPYNPNTAEATDMEITTNPDDDQKVVGEARAGYRLKDRIIRPARVKVAKYVAPAQA